jgi:flagellar protein FliL
MESAVQEAPIEVAPEEFPGPASKLPLLMIVVAGLIAGGAVGLFLTGPAIAAKLNRPSAASAESGAKGEHGKDAKGAKSGDQRVLRVIDNLVLNPAGSGGTRFLMITASIELNSTEADELLKGRDAQVRDALLSYFSRKTVVELADVGARDQIRKDVIALLTPLVQKGAITAVYFPQFVIQ